jgi:hypothetical protein
MITDKQTKDVLLFIMEQRTDFQLLPHGLQRAIKKAQIMDSQLQVAVMSMAMVTAMC